MARIRSLKRDSQPARSPRTEVDCLYTTVLTDRGDKLLRLATLGSDHRKLEPKPSQIIEMDENIAQQLVGVIFEVYPGIRTAGSN